MTATGGTFTSRETPVAPAIVGEDVSEEKPKRRQKGEGVRATVSFDGGPEIPLEEARRAASKLYGTEKRTADASTGEVFLLTVPEEGDFTDEDGELTEYLEAPGLEELAKRLIRKHHCLSAMFAGIAPIIHYRWKREGGETGGRVKLGDTKKTSGLLRHYAGADFVIWLAADHLEACSYVEIERALFHELKHVGVDEKGRLVAVPHEYEGTFDELRLYGEKVPTLRALVTVAQQLTLPGLEGRES